MSRLSHQKEENIGRRIDKQRKTFKCNGSEILHRKGNNGV